MGVEARAVEVAALELGVGGVEPRRVHATRGDADHPRPAAEPQCGQEQAREQEGPEDVGRERQLDAVVGPPPLGRQHAGVVDEHVEPVVAREKAGAEAPHVVEVREVAELDLEPAARSWRRASIRARAAAPALEVSDQHVDAGAGREQALAGCLAEP